ncbi:hypothetical protein [Tardibacter chloracetimidivorans]|uniref:hypothetical protein n=1 Tax=Tardibacter chloracetimidivorans TaxID=1921510 RepID=UPI001D045CA9|nr:hypothetical protein [Tardibacter chloracetimidivorans]
MLGHADLKSTEIYTQVSIKALKAIHTATHPARPIARAEPGPADPEARAEVAALFAILDREAEEEDASA